MTDLTIYRGDSIRFRIEVTDGGSPASPIDLTGAVLKFAVKTRVQDTNAESSIFKTSYFPDQILIDDPVNGMALVYIWTEDTYLDPSCSYVWDLETTRRDGIRTTAGTIAVETGSTTMTGTGLDLTSISVGDILVPAGALPANQVGVTIQAVNSNGTLETDYTGFETETGIPLTVYRGNRKTPVGLQGAFNITADVVI